MLWKLWKKQKWGVLQTHRQHPRSGKGCSAFYPLSVIFSVLVCFQLIKRSLDLFQLVLGRLGDGLDTGGNIGRAAADHVEGQGAEAGDLKEVYGIEDLVTENKLNLALVLTSLITQ